MANVFDVAKYILENTDNLSTWKLQKLCYYAQAWTLAWDGAELFPENFEAWANGPVCRELFNEHKGKFLITDTDLTKGNSSCLDEEEKQNIDIIINDYGSKDAYWLREQTHNEEPWKTARNGCPEGELCNNIITKDSLGAYYGSL